MTARASKQRNKLSEEVFYIQASDFVTKIGSCRAKAVWDESNS